MLLNLNTRHQKIKPLHQSFYISRMSIDIFIKSREGQNRQSLKVRSKPSKALSAIHPILLSAIHPRNTIPVSYFMLLFCLALTCQYISPKLRTDALSARTSSSSQQAFILISRETSSTAGLQHLLN